MSDHMAAIGFDLSSVEELEGLAYLAVEQGQVVAGARGVSVVWSPLPGVELWVAAEGERLAACTPSFRGPHVQAVHPVDALPHPECAVEGVWALTLDALPEAPLHVHMADFTRHEVPPARANIHLSAFVHTARLWPDAARFASDHDPDAHPPLSTLVAEGAPEDATARLTGTIQTIERVSNPVGRGQLYHMALALGAVTIDLVAATGAIRQRPRVGGVLSAEVWLCGALA